MTFRNRFPLLRPPVVAVALFCLGPPSASADLLKLPQSPADYEALLKQSRPQDCTHCGVVVSIRTEALPSGGLKVQALPGIPSPDGPGEDLVGTPLIGTGDAAKQYREPSQPAIVYVVTVHYDNGAYGRVELDKEPALREGDRVRVADGEIDLE